MAVFYRKYRPQKIADLIGHEHIKKTLLAQLESGKISHGYLFAGPKGTGKTSTARILAKAVNCEVYSSQFTVHSKKKTMNHKPSTVNQFGEPCGKCTSCLAIAGGSHLDLVEIDAASNRGIDEIRDLRERIKFSPVSSRFKVYIVDEAHMLTSEAFNAFLKTLEEPPGHAIFVLCTTEPGKLPATIISRLSRFNFARAREVDLESAVVKIAQKESIEIEKEAIRAIAKFADGSFRDAISLLDQLSTSGKVIAESDVINVAKLTGWSQLYVFVQNLAESDLKGAVLTIEEMVKIGTDFSLFTQQLVLFLEKILFIKIGSLTDLLIDLEKDQLEKLTVLAEKFTSERLCELMRLLLVVESEIKVYPLAQIPLVLSVCKFCKVDDKSLAQAPQTNNASARRVVSPKDSLEKDDSQKTVVSEKKQKTRGDQPKTLDDINRHWSDFLNRVKPVNAHVVALLKSTRPTEFDGVNLTLEVFYRFHKERLESLKITKMLSSVLEEIMGFPIRLKLVLAARETSPPKAVMASDVVDVAHEDLEKIAQEIFSK